MSIIGDVLPAIGAFLVGSAGTAASTSTLAVPLSGLAATVTTPAVAATSGLIGTGGAITAGGVASGLQMVSGLGSIATGIGQAITGASAAEQQAAYAERVAKAEAIAARAEDRKLLSTQKARYGAAGVTGATPLMVELDTARLIDQRYRDRLFRGTVSAFESRSRIPSLVLGGAATAAGGLTTLASSLYKTRNPLLVE